MDVEGFGFARPLSVPALSDEEWTRPDDFAFAAAAAGAPYASSQSQQRSAVVAIASEIVAHTTAACVPASTSDASRPVLEVSSAPQAASAAASHETNAEAAMADGSNQLQDKPLLNAEVKTGARVSLFSEFSPLF